MFVESLPEGTQRSLALLAASGLPQPFYLAGGTAVALYFGHRISIDLDFFGLEHFDADQLAAQLADLGQFQLDRIAPDTLLGEFEGIKISFFRYRYPLIGEPVFALGIRFASLRDIAAMKLDAISRRGTRRDFIDLYLIVQSGLSVPEAMDCYRDKYAGLNMNLVHIAKSLAYFADAEADPMPRMLTKVSWEKVTRFFEREARSLLRSL